VVSDHELCAVLGVAVRICGTEWTFFWNGNHIRDTGGIPVDGCGGGIDNIGDIVSLGRSEQAQSSVDIDMIVLEGDLARFTDSLRVLWSALPMVAGWEDEGNGTYLQRSKVDNTVNLWMFGEDLVKSFLFCDIQIVVDGLLAANEFDAIEDFLRRVVEVVYDYDFVAGFEKRESSERANVPSTAEEGGSVRRSV